MSLPDDVAPSRPGDMRHWPREARQTYVEMVWTRKDLIATLLDASDVLTEERMRELRDGNLRLKKNELAAITVAMHLDLPEP